MTIERSTSPSHLAALPGGRGEAALDPSLAYRANTAFLGMTIFLGSWAMLFAGLFFAYGVVRVGAHVWPPRDLPRLPLALPAIATVLIAGASVALQTALARVRNGRLRGNALLLAGALGASTAFLFLQLRVWVQLFSAGLRPETGTYASVFYGFTVFHALHVLVGLVGLGIVLVGCLRGRYQASSHVGLRLWTLYFHMVGVVWALMYLSIYVV